MARSSPPFLPKTHLRPLPAINIEGAQALTDKLKALSAAFAPYAERMQAISEHLAGVGAEHRRRQEQLYADIARMPASIPTIRRAP